MKIEQLEAADGLRLHDGMGNLAGHKRGYAFGGNDEQRLRAAGAYDERTARAQNAWRSPAALAERKARYKVAQLATIRSFGSSTR